MENIYIFILTLFLGKSVLLTPVPIDVNGSFEITVKKSLNVVSSEPYISIDVTSMLRPNVKPGVDLLAFEKVFKTKFPADSIEVLLFEKNGEITKLTHISFAQDNEKNWLVLSKNGVISTNKKFVKVLISSKVVLKDISVTWTNYTL
jgi:hypothetical protein